MHILRFGVYFSHCNCLFNLLFAVRKRVPMLHFIVHSDESFDDNNMMFVFVFFHASPCPFVLSSLFSSSFFFLRRREESDVAEGIEFIVCNACRVQRNAQVKLKSKMANEDEEEAENAQKNSIIVSHIFPLN